MFIFFLNSLCMDVNYTTLYSWCENFGVTRQCLQGQIDMWIGPSSRGQLPKKIGFFLFDVHLSQSIIFRTLEIWPKCIIWLWSEFLSKIEDFFYEVYIKSVTLKVEGPNHDIFGDLALDSAFQHVRSKFANHVRWSHAQPWSCQVEKNLTQFGHVT